MEEREGGGGDESYADAIKRGDYTKGETTGAGGEENKGGKGR